jgi:hypothetical protein
MKDAVIIATILLLPDFGRYSFFDLLRSIKFCLFNKDQNAQVSDTTKMSNDSKAGNKKI